MYQLFPAETQKVNTEAPDISTWGQPRVGRRSSILEKLILYINTYILFLLLDIT